MQSGTTQETVSLPISFSTSYPVTICIDADSGGANLKLMGVITRTKNSVTFGTPNVYVASYLWLAVGW